MVFFDTIRVKDQDRLRKWVGEEEKAGNSADQAAMFLAETTKCVHMLVRSAGLAESMLRYLIRRIGETATIVLRPHAEGRCAFVPKDIEN